PGVGGCDSAAARRTRATAATTGLCARGSRLRRGGDSAWAVGGILCRGSLWSYRAREWSGPVAVGGRADVCMAQPVPTRARPLRQAGRHPRGVPLARVRADLLAVAVQDVEDRLSGCPNCPAPNARSPFS